MKQEDKDQHDLTVRCQEPMPCADPTAWAAEEGAILTLLPSGVFPNSQPQAPMAQFKAVSFCPCPLLPGRRD